MTTTKYNLKRRHQWQGMRTRNELLADIWQGTKKGAQIAAVMLLIVLGLGWLQERDLRDAEADAIERAKAAEAKAHKMLAHVLNGRSLIDHKTGDVFFVQVSRQEGL
jgi:hypothetical protein